MHVMFVHVIANLHMLHCKYCSNNLPTLSPVAAARPFISSLYGCGSFSSSSPLNKKLIAFRQCISVILKSKLYLKILHASFNKCKVLENLNLNAKCSLISKTCVYIIPFDYALLSYNLRLCCCIQCILYFKRKLQVSSVS